MRSTRKRKHEEHENLERWLVSYADFITLLFAFFTTLYAISNVDKAKLSSMVDSMRSAFGTAGSSLVGASSQGGRPEGSPLPSFLPSSPPPPSPTPKETEGNGDGRDPGRGELEDMKAKVDEVAAALGMTSDIITFIDERGLVIQMAAGKVFDPGKAEIRPVVFPILDTIGKSLLLVDNDVQMEGHTDNVPISSGLFASNWELSTSRATNVLKFLLEHHRPDPARLSAAGYGEFHPIADNSSEEGRAKNRRVDVIVLLAKRKGDTRVGSAEKSADARPGSAPEAIHSPDQDQPRSQGSFESDPSPTRVN